MVLGILLAAGAARRMGSDKLQAPWRGSTVLATTMACWAAVPEFAEILLVRRSESPEIQGPRLRTLLNSDAAEGMGSSLRLAAQALPAGTEAVAVGLADMPEVAAVTISALIDAWRPLGRAGIVAPVYKGQRGHPVVFGAVYLPALRALTGDRGARTILQEHAADLHLVEVDDPGVVIDLDTPADLELLP